MNNLLSLLAKDSASVAVLEAIYAGERDHPEFAIDAIWALRQLDADSAWRAVWLLMRLAQEQRLSETELTRIAECAEEQTQWISRLAICQLFSAMRCPVSARETLFPFLADCFADRRVIVRAWAISALASFREDPAYRSQVIAMFRQARSDPRKSMQARLRHLPKR